MKKHLFVFLVCYLPVFAWAQAANFEVDENLQVNARKWADEFVKFATAKYEVELDFSHQSIKYLDDIADDLHKDYVDNNPAEELVVPFARGLGSYIAEVYRIFNGGKWGWLELEDGSYPAVQTASGANILPLAKALDRIKTGAAPDLWEYYQLLSSE